MILESKNLLVRKIIMESDNKELPIKNYFKSLYDEGIEYLKEKEVELGVDLQFLFTFGAAIPPLSKVFSEFYQFKYPELNERDINLLVVSILSVIFSVSKDSLLNLYNKIKEQGLNKELKSGEDFLKKRNEKLNSFFTKVGIGVKNYTNIIKFSALVPILPVIVNMFENSELNSSDIFKIFGSMVIWLSFEKSGDFLKEFFSGLIKSSRSYK